MFSSQLIFFFFYLTAKSLASIMTDSSQWQFFLTEPKKNTKLKEDIYNTQKDYHR